MSTKTEQSRVASLIEAQTKAQALFDVATARGIVRTGRSEREISDEIRDLAGTMFGVKRYWHKRIVRSGPHTLEPYAANPPDRVLEADDIAFCDFGPIFEEWEADFGRTFVLGNDPNKHQLCADLPRVWGSGRDFFAANPEVTGAELYAHVVQAARDAGWDHGGAHAGHLVGEFPHEKIAGDQVECYVTPGNQLTMRRLERSGRPCHWILEVHLVDRENGYGGFFEQLLDLGHDDD